MEQPGPLKKLLYLSLKKYLFKQKRKKETEKKLVSLNEKISYTRL